MASPAATSGRLTFSWCRRNQVTRSACEMSPHPVGSGEPAAVRARPRQGANGLAPAIASTSITQTTCYMCACRCGINVHLQRRAGPLYRGQQDSSGEPRRALRQGRRRHHAALLAGAAAQAAEARRRARRRRVRRDRMGRGARRSRPSWLDAIRRSDPQETRLLHRPRPEPVADRLVGGAVRHAQFRRPWRLLLGQHGRRRALHDRRLVLGVRRAGLGAHQILHDVRRRRGP